LIAPRAPGGWRQSYFRADRAAGLLGALLLLTGLAVHSSALATLGGLAVGPAVALQLVRRR